MSWWWSSWCIFRLWRSYKWFGLDWFCPGTARYSADKTHQVLYFWKSGASRISNMILIFLFPNQLQPDALTATYIGISISHLHPTINHFTFLDFMHTLSVQRVPPFWACRKSSSSPTSSSAPSSSTVISSWWSTSSLSLLFRNTHTGNHSTIIYIYQKSWGPFSLFWFYIYWFCLYTP